MKEVTEGVKEVELEDQPKKVVDEEDKAPESVPLPAEEAGELDEVTGGTLPPESSTLPDVAVVETGTSGPLENDIPAAESEGEKASETPVETKDETSDGAPPSEDPRTQSSPAEKKEN